MSSETKKKTIIVRGEGIQIEGAAAAAFLPGTFLERGTGGTLQPYSGTGPLTGLVALNNSMVGQSIESEYAEGEQVVAQYASTGFVVNAVCETSAPILAGDALVVGPDGVVLPASAGSNSELYYTIGTAYRDVAMGETRVQVEVALSHETKTAVVQYSIDTGAGTVAVGNSLQLKLQRTVDGDESDVPGPLQWVATASPATGISIDSNGLLTVAAGATASSVSVTVNGVSAPAAAVTITA